MLKTEPTSSFMLQSRILSHVKKLLGKKHYIDDLAETLSLSNDSVYRRVRCETPLNIIEIENILARYDLSLEDFMDTSKRRVTFNFQPIGEGSFTFVQYLYYIRGMLEMITQSTQKHMLYFANDIPLFQLMNAPVLASFKLFFWRKTILDFPEFKDQKFSLKHRDEEINNVSRRIRNHYFEISSTEVYSPETIDTTLNEIDYYVQSGHFEDNNDALVILDSLSNLVEHLRQQCEAGKRFKPVKPGEQPPHNLNHEDVQYKVLYNEILFTDATILVQLDDQKWSYLTNNGLNILSTKDEHFYDKCFDAFRILEKRSTLISGNSEKQRNKVFNRYQKRIDQLRKKLEYEMEHFV